ncbi:unnamed protein product [Cylindrotheca closterium]|uniref:Ndc10 domain-containing protein n=1 Tax=Cylindrotheca closterium TaxID=2856 RepID=A0AAD2G7G8_9STRA|nr:unnamed protein product [Cylindrotheca closterium]
MLVSPVVTRSPSYPVDALVMNTYKSAIWNIFREQQNSQSTSLVWDQIWQPNCKSLIRHVKSRRKVIARQNYEEKMDTSFTFFKGANKDTVLKEAMWEQGQDASNLRAALPSIRHRFTFLFSTMGILRGESIFSVEFNKMPTAAMRAAADFIDGDGVFFCPRSQVNPPQELLNKIFPFVDEQLARVNAAIQGEDGRDKSGVYLGSAKCFLEMLVRLRTIILQDAAAIIALHPVRRSHAMFNSFSDIFRTPESIAYTAEMRSQLGAAQAPMDYNIQAALPGVHARMTSHEEATRQIAQQVSVLPGLVQRVNALPQLEDFEALIGRALMRAALAFKSPPPWDNPHPATNIFNVATNAATSTANNEPRINRIHHRLISTHDNIRSIYDEWFGLGQFEEVPISGGIAECEKKFGAKWRNKNSPFAWKSDQQSLFSLHVVLPELIFIFL